MPKRMLVFAFALTLLVGLDGHGVLAVGKTPGDHVNSPTPPVPLEVKQVCTFVVAAFSAPGVSDTPTHNAYEVVGIDVECPLSGPVFDPNLAGHYDVVASGTTDGPDHLTYFDNSGFLQVGDLDSGGSKGPGKNDPDHGEDCDVGWGVNGTIEVYEPVKDKYATGKVHFIRAGASATAWGYLVWDDPFKKKTQFLADFVLESSPAEALKCSPAVPGKITDAIASGTLQFFN